MNASDYNNGDHVNSFDRNIDIIIGVLESGKFVELPASGYSMFPTFKPGYRIIVKPAIKGELPVLGSVVVYKDNGMLVMHRVMEIKIDDFGKNILITRGDSRMEPDKPWPQQQLIGFAVSYKTFKKEHFVKTFVPTACYYKYNLSLLWLRNKIKRLFSIFQTA